MHPLASTTSATSAGDPAVAALASAQHGVVTRDQLTAAGLGRNAIAYRIAQRRLHRLHRGVYLLGHAAPPPLAREMAAVLACGEGAVLSHLAAAALWDLRPCLPGEIDVTVTGRDSRRRLGVRVHCVSRLDDRDIRRHERIPLTAPARTLLDVAEFLPRRQLERSVEEAQVRRLVSRDQLYGVIARNPGRHGLAALRALLDRDAKASFTRSEAEARLLELVRTAGLTSTHVNTRIGAYEVDMVWLPERLIVEVDGFAYHSTRAAFERDRLRDGALQAAGYRVMRVTWRQLEAQPEAVVNRLARALGR
jgi:very-short-patch-repair endonuclease